MFYTFQHSHDTTSTGALVRSLAMTRRQVAERDTTRASRDAEDCLRAQAKRVGLGWRAPAPVTTATSGPLLALTRIALFEQCGHAGAWSGSTEPVHHAGAICLGALHEICTGNNVRHPPGARGWVVANFTCLGAMGQDSSSPAA